MVNELPYILSQRIDTLEEEIERLRKLLRAILKVTDQQTRTTSQGEVRWEMWERLVWIGDQIEKEVAPAPNGAAGLTPSGQPRLKTLDDVSGNEARRRPEMDGSHGKAGTIHISKAHPTGDVPAWMTKRLRTNILNGNGELVEYIDEHGIKHDVKKEAKKRNTP